MRRRRTTSAVHADRMIPKLLKNMPGINAVFFLFIIFLISAALTIFVNQTVYAETYAVIIPAAQEDAGAESAVESASEAETAPLSEDRVSISFQMDSNGIYGTVNK